MICFESCMPLSQFGLVVIFFVAFFSTIFCHIALRLTLDRRVRKALPANKVYDGFFDGFFGMLRSMLFANASIRFMKGSKKNMEIYYNGFDVVSFANRFEKTMAYIQFLSLILILLSVIAVFLTEWLGVFEWPDT